MRHGLRSSLTVAPAIALLVLVPSLASAQERPGHAKVEQIRTLGGPNSVTDAPLEGRDDLQRFFDTDAVEILSILGAAGWDGPTAELFSAVRGGRFTEVEVPVGQQMHWIALRRNGLVNVVRNARWEGEAPFEAFRVEVAGADWIDTFVIPKACGNLTLLTRRGTGQVSFTLASGEMQLVDPEGRTIDVRPGQPTTVSASRAALPDSELQSPEVPTTVTVEEGEVEFLAFGRPVAVSIAGGNAVHAQVAPTGEVQLEVPESNRDALPIRIGDAVGTIAAGSGISAQWTPPVCHIAVGTAAECPPGELTVDATGSSVSHGRITAVAVDVTRPDGSVVQLPEPDRAGVYRWSMDFTVEGRYQFDAVAIADTAAASQNRCHAEIVIDKCMPPPPTCAIAVDEAAIQPWGTVTWDASGSASDGGTVTAVEMTLVGPGGAELTRETLRPPFTGSQSFEVAGDYTLTATAVDGDGQRSTNTCQATFEVRPRNRFSGWILAGVRNTDTPPPDGEETSGVFGIRGSLDWLLRENLDLSAGIGVALVVDGNPSVFVDLSMDWKLSPTFFLGTGPGYWDIAHSDTRGFDWLVRAGYDTPWTMGGWDTALVVEGRASLENSGDYVAVLGLRLREQ